MEQCGEVFSKSIVTQEGYVTPDEYNADFEGTSLKTEDYSDIGQAKVLVREYGDELKYTSATDYLRFDGECWREDKQMAIGAHEEFLDLQLQDAMDEVARVESLIIHRYMRNVGIDGAEGSREACLWEKDDLVLRC